MREMQREGDAQDIAPKKWIQIILKPNWLHKPAHRRFGNMSLLCRANL
jgi:hypothetical protein